MTEQDRLFLQTEALCYYLSGCGKGPALYAKAGVAIVSLSSSAREMDLFLFFIFT